MQNNMSRTYISTIKSFTFRLRFWLNTILFATFSLLLHLLPAFTVILGGFTLVVLYCEL